MRIRNLFHVLLNLCIKSLLLTANYPFCHENQAQNAISVGHQSTPSSNKGHTPLSSWILGTKKNMRERVGEMIYERKAAGAKVLYTAAGARCALRQKRDGAERRPSCLDYDTDTDRADPSQYHLRLHIFNFYWNRINLGFVSSVFRHLHFRLTVHILKLRTCFQLKHSKTNGLASTEHVLPYRAV